jgi:hypothetical protein
MVFGITAVKVEQPERAKARSSVALFMWLR